MQDYAPISQGSDDQSVCTTQELILIAEINISDGDDAFIFILLEVESWLLQPLEVLWWLDVHACKIPKYIYLMHMNGNESLKLDSVDLGEIGCCDVDQLVQDVDEALGSGLHHLLVNSSIL